MTCKPSELDWFKSTYSASNSNDCVEVARTPDTIHVRDSKDPHGPQLTFTAEAWASFVTHVGTLT
ncbi:toxin [Wenjunlia vitaminophila]|uniref:Toxin n=1 Tax=Wenjunlia vitaminophila TaxID=76728 RepID=A0A0T6LXL3_WENVI|nr:DUF397 domain-containing protein [Wenjunlia vitaminophila]KRV50778.1 toxin [Wenjunlia vitaminophila]